MHAWLWTWIGISLGGAVIDGVVTGLRRYYGPNIGDALRRKRLVDLEYELSQAEQASNCRFPHCVWWYSGYPPLLADYASLVRVIEDATLRAQARSLTETGSCPAVARSGFPARLSGPSAAH